MKKNNRLFLYSAISIFCIVIIYFLYPVYHPNISICPDYSVNQIKEKTENFLKEQKFNYEKEVINVFTGKNQPLIKEVQKKFGLKKGNILLRKNLPAYYYEVNLVKENEITVSNDFNKKDKKKADEKTPDNSLLTYDFKGNIILYNRKMDDSVQISKIPQAEAKALILSFANKYTSMFNNISSLPSVDTIISLESNNQIGKEIYKFRWTAADRYSTATIIINATVTGNIVTHFSVDYSFPNVADNAEENMFVSLIEIVIYILVLLAIGITGYKKIRAFEIGFKNAIIVGVFAGLNFGIFVLMQMGSNLQAESLIPVAVIFLFWGILIFIIWAVMEAVVRELWKDKFRSFDYISKGDLLHSKIGENIIAGINWGIIGLTIYLCVISFIDSNISNLQILPSDDAIRMFNNKYVFLYFFNTDLHFNVFYLAVFIAFLSTMLSKRITKNYAVYLIIAIIWGLVHRNSIDPFYFAIIVQFILGAVLLYVFYKHDVLTTIIAMCTYVFLMNTLHLFWLKNSSFQQFQLIPVFVCGLLIIYAVITLTTKDIITDYNSIIPEFAVHITERQRLQRELEIARDVQMSFLPRQNPSVTELDIASKCVPAMEVGGDYYDFIEFGKNQLGVVVGDVSGKGTQAAFYMTLSKGFLKAIAKTSSSPKEVLIKMNNMFYENVDRGNFITMVLGVFDLDTKKFVFASAGHNPVIYKNNSANKIEFLNSKGMALGLERGEIFAKTITESSIPFAKDDVFVMYTDGFTEAMNNKREEYGEEKLLEILESQSNNLSQEILNAYFSAVKTFIGKAIQHDDMSMAVVKIK